MWEFLQRLDGGAVIWLVIALGATVYYVTHTLAKQWRLVRQTEIEATLKAEMIKQGKSLDEIAQVLRLSQTSVRDEEEESEELDEAHQKEEDFLVEMLDELLDQDKPAEDIARVLQAYQPAADAPFPIQEERRAMLKRAILRKMVEHERSGEDIERVLQAIAITTNPAGQRN